MKRGRCSRCVASLRAASAPRLAQPVYPSAPPTRRRPRPRRAPATSRRRRRRRGRSRRSRPSSSSVPTARSRRPSSAGRRRAATTTSPSGGAARRRRRRTRPDVRTRPDAGAPRRAQRRHAVGHLLLLLQRSVAVAEGLVVQPADHEPALDLSRRPRAPVAARHVRAAAAAGRRSPTAAPSGEAARSAARARSAASSVGLKQTAFVEKSDLDKSITIDGSVDEKELLGDRRLGLPELSDGQAAARSASATRSTSPATR